MYIITKAGVKASKVFWHETQESPVIGSWVMNSKRATEFSSEKTAARYSEKYLKPGLARYEPLSIEKK